MIFILVSDPSEFVTAKEYTGTDMAGGGGIGDDEVVARALHGRGR